MLFHSNTNFDIRNLLINNQIFEFRVYFTKVLFKNSILVSNIAVFSTKYCRDNISSG